MSLEALTQSPAWIVAGWTMLHFLWVAAIIGGAAVAGRWALRSASPNVRYAFALLCLGALALAPVVIATRVIHHRVGSPVSLPAGTIVMLPADSPPDGSVSRERLAGGVEAQRPGLLPKPVAIPAIADRAPLSVWMASAAGYLPWLWIVGSPMVFLTLATGLMGADRLRRQSRVLDTPDWRNTCRRLAERLKVRRAVAIATCERLVSPILVGIVRPMILLPPAALTGWTPEQVEMVLLHELAHVRRWDNLVNLLQRIVESLLFFHPVVWLVSGWVRREREHCCDAVVLKATGRPRAYAETLAALAAPTPTHRAAVALGERDLVVRIRRILKLEEHSMRLSAKTLGLVCVLFVVPLAFLTAHAAQTAKNPSPGTPDTTQKQPQGAAVGETGAEAIRPFFVNPLPGKEHGVPPLRFRTFDGRSQDLADFGDKVVLLNFWVTPCVPCQIEFPILKALYEEFGKNDRFVMIGLSVDTDVEVPRRYIAEHEKELPWLQGFLESPKLPWLQGYRGITKEVFRAGPKQGSWAKPYGIPPQYYVVGPGRRFVWRMDGKSLRDLVASALDTPSAEKAAALLFGGDAVEAPVRAAGKKSNVPDAFGPVIERVVHADHVGENCVIDLESGQRFSPPKHGSGRSTFEWIIQNGIDVGAVVNDQTRGLFGFEMVVIPVENSLWETATPSYLRAVVTWPEPGTLVAMSGLGPLPKTYLFKTREGGMGVLQVLAIVSEPDGVKFRYKRLQAEVDTAFEAKPESAPRFERTPDGRVEWIEVDRLAYDGAKPGSTFTAALQLGVIAIEPLESGRLGVFLARPAPGILGTLLMRTKAARPDLRIVFIDDAGKRHLARQRGMAHNGLKKVRMQRFENPKSCPRERIRTIVIERAEVSRDKTVQRK